MCSREEDLHNIRMDKHVLAKGKEVIIECTINDMESLPETTLGERIRKLRLLKNLTIKELSKQSCMSENTITNIEKSRAVPNITTINRLSQVLSTTIAYLLDTVSWSEESSGEIIYKYRMIKGLSQRTLANKCNLHQSTIKDYEDNKIRNPETLQIIYEILGYI